jgi:hypothetical protein
MDSGVCIEGLTMRIKPNSVNPIAKAMLQTNRRRSQVVPDKTKYNRKKEKDLANQNRSNEELENPKG